MADLRPDECEWFPLCENAAAGMAAHPDHGVIPVCQTHVDVYRIPLIRKPNLERF